LSRQDAKLKTIDTAAVGHLQRAKRLLVGAQNASQQSRLKAQIKNAIEMATKARDRLTD
jgi:hypothetical protein